MEKNNSASTSGNVTRNLVITGLLTSLVCIATFINIRSPISVGGLMHLGNTVLFMAAIVFGKRKAAFAGAFGMGLFDVMSGWILWAPFTFIIRGVMGYIIGAIANANGRKGSSSLWNIIAILVGGIWMLAGYYITEIILYGDYILPIKSIPGNIVQIVLGLILGLPLSKVIIKLNINQKLNMNY